MNRNTSVNLASEVLSAGLTDPPAASWSGSVAQLISQYMKRVDVPVAFLGSCDGSVLLISRTLGTEVAPSVSKETITEDTSGELIRIQIGSDDENAKRASTGLILVDGVQAEITDDSVTNISRVIASDIMRSLVGVPVGPISSNVFNILKAIASAGGDWGFYLDQAVGPFIWLFPKNYAPLEDVAPLVDSSVGNPAIGDWEVRLMPTYAIPDYVPPPKLWFE